MPVAASSVAANPDPYIGEYVTMTGAVEANLSKTSFSVDQDKTKSTGKDVLVLAPNLQKPADTNGYVTVIGQLIKFDRGRSGDEAQRLQDRPVAGRPGEVQGQAGRARHRRDQYRGHRHRQEADPADDGRRPHAAEDHDQAAAGAGRAAQGARRQAADLVKEQATILKTSFTETEAFWKAKGNEEAMNRAADGKKHADSILMNVGHGNFDAAKTSVTPLGARAGAATASTANEWKTERSASKPLSKLESTVDS